MNTREQIKKDIDEFCLHISNIFPEIRFDDDEREERLAAAKRFLLGSIEQTILLNYEIGNWIDKKCPKCGSTLLGNKLGDEWCSFTKCDYNK